MPVNAQNFGFEEGINGWVASYQSPAGNHSPSPTQEWSSEGNTSILFGKSNGFGSFGPVKSAINHSFFETHVGDAVCLDFKKNGTFGSIWTLRSSVLGTIRSPIFDGIFTDLCFPAIYRGKLDFIVEGNPQGCIGTCFNTKIFLDNIKVYACDDDVKNGFETDVDCGGSCSRCMDNKLCAVNADCESYYCMNKFCAPSPSFMYANNLNFEQGLNTNWTYGGRQGGADITSGVSTAWSSEGNFGMRFSQGIYGIKTTNGLFVNATHAMSILTGDRVCMDLKKQSVNGNYWRVRLGTGGVFLNAPLFNGVYNNTCATSSGNGSLSIVVETSPNAPGCTIGVGCYGDFIIDNVTINAHLCGNGILDGYETTPDCGGFCGECAIQEEDLLAKYAPVLYFHPDEQFFPTTIDAMLNESDLKHIVEWEEDYINDNMPVDVSSLNHKNETYYLDMRNATAGYTSIGPNPDRFDKYPRTIYGRQVDTENFTVLQYWFFYPFNDFRGGHEGDWEMIQLLLDFNTKEPKFATYSFHYNAKTYEWEELQKVDNTHSKVFIALGGHASYIKDESEWDLAPYTREKVASEGDSTINSNLKVKSMDNWIFFKGVWGEWDGNNSLFNGPRSPFYLAYKNQTNRWEHPVEFASNSRPNEKSLVSHSPVHIHAYDKQGRHTGLNELGEIEAEIPGTYLYMSSNGSEEVIIILTDEDITFVAEATDEGEVTLDITNYDSSTKSEVKTAYQNISLTTETTLQVNIEETNPNFILQIDEDGDGDIETTQLPDQTSIEGNYSPQEEDVDNDGLADSVDNCPTLYNPNQNTDFDGDEFNNELCSGNDCNDEEADINPSQTEACDNVDNNCNLQVDENLFFTFGTDIGACEFGTQTCSLGTYSITTPSINPVNETCNGADDDCDASTDEELSREYGIDVGECVKGTEVCNNGNWNVSVRSKDPSQELCNGKDDDCDGQIDNICARNTKQYAIQLLEEAKNAVFCDKRGFCLDKTLSEVIGDIQKSLDLRYYIDNETLKSNKGKDNGENVFEHEIDAIKECLRGKSFRSIHPICEEVANLLTVADKKFAEKALADAKNVAIVNSKNQKCYSKEVEKAERFLTKADSVLSENFPRIEILNYKKSWEHSQEAVSIAKSAKKEC